MRVSWRYTANVSQENPAKSRNQLFSKIVNVLHDHTEGNNPSVENIARSTRLDFLSGLIFSYQLKCLKGMYSPQLEESFSDQLGNISSEDVFRTEVSQETLQRAAEIYIYLVHCPDNYYPILSLKGFYTPLIEKSSLRTLLLSLARMISTTRNQLRTAEMTTATLLLRKLSGKMKLGYEDLDILTSSFSDIRNDKDLVEKYKGLTERLTDSLERETIRRINHPAHITEIEGKKSPSAFIPFCSFGGNMSAVGQHSDQFDHPTCNSFRETILEGNLCYEIDPSNFENDGNLKKSKNIGLSLLIDNNEEYDTKKIILKGESTINQEDFTEGFIRFEERQKTMIHIQTIS